jgi:glycolate oxidase FAD binding subunit
VIEPLIERIRAAHAAAAPLVIQGGGSKGFYGNAAQGEILDTRSLHGVVDYQPKELVLTARAGTPLAEIEALLAEHKQMLAFEPPHFSPSVEPSSHSTKPASGQVAGYPHPSPSPKPFPPPQPSPQMGEGAVDALRAPKAIYATLGGCVASGLSGPRRPYTGAVRDYVLGVRMIDGTGQALRFGGQVIKNVAGYDVSRLMVGALGTLGLITEVSLKVLPKPAAELSLQFELAEASAIAAMNRWAGQPLPLSATSWHAGLLTLRLSGAASAVAAARTKLGGAELHDAAAFWQRLREQTTPFFDQRPPPSNKNLWRLAVKSTTGPLQLGDAQWIEWGGAVRWLASDLPAAALREAAHGCGGHATLFRGETGARFHPLPPALLTLHKNLKLRFDPKGIFNRGRLYPDF